VFNRCARPSELAELAEGLASQERRRLGLGNQPVIYLRNWLESAVGMRTFYCDTLPPTVAGIYDFDEELGCFMLINGKHPPDQCRVTLLRGYARLFTPSLYKPDNYRIMIYEVNSKIDRFGRNFATNFLKPPEFIPPEKEQFSERYIRLVSQAYARGKIGDSELSHYLRVDLVTGREIVNRALEQKNGAENAN
jgi:hypothetical protein